MPFIFLFKTVSLLHAQEQPGFGRAPFKRTSDKVLGAARQTLLGLLGSPHPRAQGRRGAATLWVSATG